MRRALIKITRAGLLNPGDGICILSNVPAPRNRKPGDPETVARWFVWKVESVESFGGDLRIFNLMRRPVEGAPIRQTFTASKTAYLPRLVAWVKEDNDE